MRQDDLLELLEKHVNPERICTLAAAIHQLDQWNSFDRYKQTADLLVREFEQAGAESVERTALPCDGAHTFGDWVMPMAWDAQEGTLELLDESGRRNLLLADYRAVPNNLIRWSAATAAGGQEFELVYVPDATKEEAWASFDPKGKLIFTHTAGRVARFPAAKHGAAGVVTDFSRHPDDYPDAVHWENAWTSLALWGPTRRDKPMIGFCLSPAMGKELKGRFRREGSVRMVRANVRARLYEGTTDVVSAAFPGAEQPQQEIVVYAHVYECQIDDNATSAAALVEMARVMRGLIDAGLLPSPRRTIRFVLGWEWIGSTHTAMNRPAGSQWIASLCCDGLAHTQRQTRSPIGISLSPTTATSFADALFVHLFKQQYRRRLPAKAWRTENWGQGTDTYWIDPHLGGVSNVYPFQQPGPTWHKSHTTADMIDRDVLRGSTVACLGWLLEIAAAGAEGAEDFARLAADRVERRIRRYEEAFDFRRRDVEIAKERLQAELGYLEEAARRMIDTSVLAPDDADLRKVIDDLVHRVEGAVQDVKVRAREAFAAASDGVPEWERRRPLDLLIDRDERVADNIVPARQVQGYLWSLHRVPEEERRALMDQGRLDALVLFLADGKRSLREIARRFEFEQGRGPNVRTLLRQFRTLAEAGYVQLTHKRTFTAADLLADLRRLGVREGDTILVHSSLSGLGPLADGEKTVFAALEQAVGEGGTVVMPSFVHSTLERPPYDPAHTPTRTGELTDRFWRRPGVLRSRHPSHGLAAWGRWASFLVADNEQYEPYDIRGGFGRLYQLDAKVLMIGCGLQANSTLHAVEDWADLPSMVPGGYHYLDAAGQRREMAYQKIPQHYRQFYLTRLSVYERLFRDKGILREGEVGLARTFVMRSRDVMEYGLELLQKRSFEFLLGRGVRDPAMQEIYARLQSQWTFPADIWDKMKALKETPP